MSDPDALDVPTAALLDPDYLSDRAAQIDMAHARQPCHGIPRHGGTVYLAAADAPRWRVTGGLDVAVETGFADDTLRRLAARGHRLAEHDPQTILLFGGAHLVQRLDDGYLAASDHRRDGQAVGF